MFNVRFDSMMMGMMRMMSMCMMMCAKNWLACFINLSI